MSSATKGDNSLCSLAGHFKTARKIGRNWVIDDSEFLPDKRIKSGKLHWISPQIILTTCPACSIIKSSSRRGAPVSVILDPGPADLNAHLFVPREPPLYGAVFFFPHQASSSLRYISNGSPLPKTRTGVSNNL